MDQATRRGEKNPTDFVDRRASRRGTQVGVLVVRHSGIDLPAVLCGALRGGIPDLHRRLVVSGKT